MSLSDRFRSAADFPRSPELGVHGADVSTGAEQPPPARPPLMAKDARRRSRLWESVGFLLVCAAVVLRVTTGAIGWQVLLPMFAGWFCCICVGYWRGWITRDAQTDPGKVRPLDGKR